MHRAEVRAGIAAVMRRLPWAEFWRFTTPRAMQSIVQIALQRLGIVLVSADPGSRACAAVYAAVTRFLVFGQLGSQAITAAVQPQIGALMVRRTTTARGTSTRCRPAGSCCCAGRSTCGLAVFSRQIPRSSGAATTRAPAVLVVLAGAMLFATAAGMVDAVLAMAGRTTWTLMNATVALVVNVSVSSNAENSGGETVDASCAGQWETKGDTVDDTARMIVWHPKRGVDSVYSAEVAVAVVEPDAFYLTGIANADSSAVNREVERVRVLCQRWNGDQQ